MKWLIGAILLIILMWTIERVEACPPIEEAKAQFKDDFMLARMLTTEGHHLHIFANADKGTFAIVEESKDTGCVILNSTIPKGGIEEQHFLKYVLSHPNNGLEHKGGRP